MPKYVLQILIPFKIFKKVIIFDYQLKFYYYEYFFYLFNFYLIIFLYFISINDIFQQKKNGYFQLLIGPISEEYCNLKFTKHF